MVNLRLGVPNNGQGELVIVRLNARMQPVERGEYFEDPLEDVLADTRLGSVAGGGTQLAEDPIGVAFCEVEVVLKETSDKAIATLIDRLEKLGAPQGSRLIFDNGREDIVFGLNEGLGLFLNGFDLPDEVYENSDVNEVIAECERLMDGAGAWRGHWQGERETALYFYGASFEAMHEAIKGFLANYPLCQRARIEQIA